MSEEGFAQSMLTQATPYTTTVHKHGRYRVIAGDVFIRHGYDYPINTTDRSGVRLDILTPIAEQLDAMLSIYSRVYFTRFDGNDSNLLIVFYVQIMPDDFVMQLHRF